MLNTSKGSCPRPLLENVSFDFRANRRAGVFKFGLRYPSNWNRAPFIMLLESISVPLFSVVEKIESEKASERAEDGTENREPE
jgi:hypothetical protein